MNTLEELRKQGYIFRGQPNSQYTLIPNAFRQNSLLSAANKFPVLPEEIYRWFFHREVLENIHGWFGIPKYTSRIREDVLIILNWFIYIMRYNYGLFQFFEKNPSYPLNDRDRKLVNDYPSITWIEEGTFLSIQATAISRLAKAFSLWTDEIILEANLDENLTGISETFAQHYDLPTAALDWSYNPSVAIYFAVDVDYEEKEQGRFVISEKIPVEADYISLYALKVIDPEKSPVEIMHQEELITNPRAQAQTGTFTYFKKPCTFYMTNTGRFPSIDDYFDSNGQCNGLSLLKFNIKKTSENIIILKHILGENDITKRSLRLDVPYAQSEEEAA